MDMALLVGDLVPLLERYEAAVNDNDDLRRGLADVILQGLSADPELLVTRLDLLGPATTIEEIFIDGAAAEARATRLLVSGTWRSSLDIVSSSIALQRPLSADRLDLDPAAAQLLAARHLLRFLLPTFCGTSR